MTDSFGTFLQEMNSAGCPECKRVGAERDMWLKLYRQSEENRKRAEAELTKTEQALFAANCMLRDLGVDPAPLRSEWMRGWQCPVCGRWLSPYVTVCPCDGRGVQYEYSSTTGSPCILGHDWDYSQSGTSHKAICRRCGALLGVGGAP